MNVDLQWLVGTAATVSVGLGSIFAGAFWKVMSAIKKVETKTEVNTETLHARINRLRDDAVYKSDLDGLSSRLSKDLHEIRDEQRTANNATNLRLDALLNAIANRNSSGGQGG